MGLWDGTGEGDDCHGEGHVKACLNSFPCTGVRNGKEGMEVSSNRPLCGGDGPWAGVGVVGAMGWLVSRHQPAVEAVTQR